MTAKLIHNVFESYQKARTSFVQSVSDLSAHSQNIESLEECGVLDLLPALLQDIEPSIQQSAAVALGRLANHNVKLAQKIVRKDILPILMKSIKKQNRFYKKAAMNTLRSIGKHTPEMAQLVVENGGLDAMVICLDDFDSGVKEAAAFALGHIARHGRNLAQSVIDIGAIPLLVLCLQEPEVCLKQVAASSLCDICKHTPEFAQSCVDAEAIPHLAKAATCLDAKPKFLLQQSLQALASIAKHSVGLAETVVEAEVFPDILVHMGHPDERVRKNAAALTREIVKHTAQLALLVVNYGGLGALLQLISTSSSNVRVQGIMAVGFIAAQSEHLAYCVIQSRGVEELATVFNTESEDHVLAATAWALGQIGKHSSEHAKVLAMTGLYPKLLARVIDPKSSEDLRCKCCLALKEAVKKCMDIEALESLLGDAPLDILKHIIGQFSKILPHNAEARKMFVLSGGLKQVQCLECEPGSTLMEYVNIVQACFPEEILRFYSPDYSKTLLDRVASYQPILPPIMSDSAAILRRLSGDSDDLCAEAEEIDPTKCDNHSGEGDPYINAIKSPSI